eukprot:scaffold435_cov342-Pavlova_lutheri.AAC.4
MPCEQLDICSTRHFCRLRPQWRKCSPKCHGSPKKHARNQAIKATCMHVYSATRPYTMPITKTPPLPLDESPHVNREELGCLGNNSEILLPNNNIHFSLIFLGMHVSLGHVVRMYPRMASLNKDDFAEPTAWHFVQALKEELDSVVTTKACGTFNRSFETASINHTLSDGHIRCILLHSPNVVLLVASSCPCRNHAAGRACMVAPVDVCLSFLHGGVEVRSTSLDWILIHHRPIRDLHLVGGFQPSRRDIDREPFRFCFSDRPAFPPVRFRWKGGAFG